MALLTFGNSGSRVALTVTPVRDPTVNQVVDTTEQHIAIEAHEIAHDMPYMKVGVPLNRRYVHTSELPIFSVNEKGTGLANDETEKAMYEHVMHAGLIASRLLQSGLRAMSISNAVLRENNRTLRRYTISVRQDTTVKKHGHVETEIVVKITRTED